MKAMVTSIWGINKCLSVVSPYVTSEMVAEVTLYAMSGLESETIFGLLSDHGRVYVTKCTCRNSWQRDCYHCCEGEVITNEVKCVIAHICDNLESLTAIPQVFFEGALMGHVTSVVIDEDSIQLRLGEDE